jgi:signal transduction histidine kinase
MLHEFLCANRGSLIERCRLKVAGRPGPAVPEGELHFGVPMFLDQLIKSLEADHASVPYNRKDIGKTAMLHGRELLQHGFSVEQVVRDYGDLCQAITSMALEMGAPIRVDEFRTLNRCLDDGIADAVVEFTRTRGDAIAEREVQVLNERVGVLAHGLRNYLNTATLALSVLKTGQVGIGGATGAALERSLTGLRSLIDRSLADVRVTAGMAPRRQHVLISELVAEIAVSASLDAKARDCGFSVVPVDDRLAVNVDRDMLLSALGNLLQNAFKFTHPHSTVTLRVHAQSDRILMDVEDECGGLPAGDSERLFAPYMQAGPNRTGMGLGLAISRRGVEAIGGTLSVRDIPGKGCVFTIDLPRDSTV